MPREGNQNWPLVYNSGMALSIVIEFGLCLETKRDAYYTGHGWGRTACAHVQMCPLFGISETGGQIAMKLVCGEGTTSYAFYTR